MTSVSSAKTSKDDKFNASTAKIEAIYISSRSKSPMESKRTARLIPGKGIDGDRYALGTGTYSGKFMGEPGKHVTMVSLEGVIEATDRTRMTPFHKGNIGEMRRNIVLSGISAEAMNEMVGHEVRIGGCRVFVHRRTVPCKYREAACRRPGLMNNLWGASGVNCEVLTPIKKDGAAEDNMITIGDTVAILQNTYQPERIDIGQKPPGFFIRPADRTPEDVKKLVMPLYIAAIACLLDPEAFQRVEDAYNSVGQRFWSTDAFAASLLLRALRIPFLGTVGVAVLSILVVIGLRLAGIEY